MEEATRCPAIRVVLTDLSPMVDVSQAKVTHSSFILVGHLWQPYRLQMVVFVTPQKLKSQNDEFKRENREKLRLILAKRHGRLTEWTGCLA